MQSLLNNDNYFVELVEWIKEHKPDKQVLARQKVKLCKKYNVKKMPTDIEVYMHATAEDAPLVKQYLQTKPMRTASGVAVVATMTKPDICPHGSCTYCPGGLHSAFGDVPKSYTGNEPSTMRGKRNNYDPYRIIFNRLEQYVVIGQNNDKVEQIVMGGTFPAFPVDYQEEYIKDSFKAYNDFSRLFFHNGVFDWGKFKTFFELPGKVGDPERTKKITEKVLRLKAETKKTLAEAQKENETAAIRCIGLTIETKPDWGLVEHGKELLKLGTTRVEIGVQTVYDDVLQHVNRGHTLEETKQSIADLRDLGFKINIHMMPGLPTPSGKRISREKDVEALKEIFANPAYRPDMLKIYPCMVMPGTALYEDYEKALYVPLDAEEAADIIVEGKRYIKPYCRVMRIQRDIPSTVVKAGVKRTNLRQYVAELAKERNVVCCCIRCREVRRKKVTKTPEIKIRKYEASNGKEFFISMESAEALFGFVRLRFPSRCLHPVITDKSALIRELHVYGTAVAIGEQAKAAQHKGYGKLLMQKAEEIAQLHGKHKMIVISGVGVREYYRHIGYQLEGPYMVKQL